MVHVTNLESSCGKISKHTIPGNIPCKQNLRSVPHFWSHFGKIQRQLSRFNLQTKDMSTPGTDFIQFVKLIHIGPLTKPHIWARLIYWTSVSLKVIKTRTTIRWVSTHWIPRVLVQLQKSIISSELRLCVHLNPSFPVVIIHLKEIHGCLVHLFNVQMGIKSFIETFPFLELAELVHSKNVKPNLEKVMK